MNVAQMSFDQMQREQVEISPHIGPKDVAGHVAHDGSRRKPYSRRQASSPPKSIERLGKERRLVRGIGHAATTR
jgi:hypothetical protein